MKPRALRLVIAFVAAGVACQNPTAFDALTVEVSATPLTVAAGDTVNIMVTARNPTDRTLTLVFDDDCQFLYRITTASGTPVTGPWFCTVGPTTLVLGPNSQGSVQYYWEASVPTGSYRAFGYLGANRAREAGPIPVTVQ